MAVPPPQDQPLKAFPAPAQEEKSRSAGGPWNLLRPSKMRRSWLREWIASPLASRVEARNQMVFAGSFLFAARNRHPNLSLFRFISFAGESFMAKSTQYRFCA